MTELHDRVTRIIREEQRQRYASEDDRIDALAAAVITGLELTEEMYASWADADFIEQHRYVTPWISDSEPAIPPNGLI